MITGLRFQTVNADCCYTCGLQEAQLCTKETGVCHNSLCNTLFWSSLKIKNKLINSFLDKFSSWSQSSVSYQKLHKQSPLPRLIKQNTNSLPTMNLDSEYKKIYKEHFPTKVSSLVDVCIYMHHKHSFHQTFFHCILSGGGAEDKRNFSAVTVLKHPLPLFPGFAQRVLTPKLKPAFSPVSHKCCQLFKQLGVLPVDSSNTVQPQECFRPWSANLDLDKVDSPAPQPSLVSLTVYQFVLVSEKASLRVTVVSTFWSFCGAWFGAFLTVKVLLPKIHLPTRFCPASTAENDFLIIHCILFNKSLCLLT